MSLFAAQNLHTLASNAQRNFQQLNALDKKAINGHCWMDLFDDPIPRDRRTKFPTIAGLNHLATEFKKSSECFEVTYLASGVIHVELSDEPTAKTVNEIFALDGGILVGGFSDDFINKYDADTMCPLPIQQLKGWV